MSRLTIQIENEKTADLEVKESPDRFGVFPRTATDYIVGFRDNPLFEISHSLAEERWFIETLPGGSPIPMQEPLFDDVADRWLRDSCCTDFSLFSFLPDGKYRLVKTGRKARRTAEILLGNEWMASPENILTFNGLKENEPVLTGSVDSLSGKRKKYYPLMVGADANRAPVIHQPLLCVILTDYGIVWDGAVGFVFFCFENEKAAPREEKKMILVMPQSDAFIIDCLNSGKSSSRKIIDDLIKII